MGNAARKQLANMRKASRGAMVALACACLCIVFACAVPHTAWADNSAQASAGQADEAIQDEGAQGADDPQALEQPDLDAAALVAPTAQFAAAYATGALSAASDGTDEPVAEAPSVVAEPASPEAAEDDPEPAEPTEVQDAAAAPQDEDSTANELASVQEPAASAQDAVDEQADQADEADQGQVDADQADEADQAQAHVDAQAAGATDASKDVQQAKALPKASSISKALRTKISGAGERLHIALVAKGTTKRTVSDGIYLVSPTSNTSKKLESAGASTATGAAADVSADLNAIHQRWAITYIKNGLYSVKNIKSGNYLAVRNGKAAFYTPVVQDAKSSAASERWKLVKFPQGYRFVSALSPWLALSVGSDAASTQVVSVRDSSTQRWNASKVVRTIDDGVYAVSNAKSNKALTVQNASISSGANVVQQSANGSLAQVFAARYDSKTGYYTLMAPSGNSLDVSGASAASGANVQIAKTNGTNAQQWSIVKAANNTYRLVSAISGKVLDVANGSTANGANLQVVTNNGTPAQRFTFKKLTNWIPEGSYRVLTALNRANALAVAGDGSAGANVATAASSDVNAQRFYLRPSGSGGYTIQNSLAGTYLSPSSTSSGANVRQAKGSQVWVPTITASGITFAVKGKSVTLDVSKGSDKAGANMQVYSPTSTKAQRFILVPTGLLADGVYTVASAANTAFVFDNYNQSRDDGVRLQVYKSNGTVAQQYRFTRLTSGAYRIANVGSGKALQAMSPSASTGQIQQQAPGSAAAQQWNLVMNADGSVSILSAASKNAVAMQLASSQPDNFVKVNTAKRSNAAAQHWKITPSNAAVYSYDTLSITLDQMATWQFSSPYNSSYTKAQMRDFLDPAKMDSYQFIDLREGAGATGEQMNKAISALSRAGGTFGGLGNAFVSAAANHGLNEIFLLSLAALESGWGTSELASGYYYGGGTIDGKTYAAGTYYNYFGIGAYDTSPLSGGRKAAIINGWSSPTKAIDGAAKWIASNYVYRSQYAQPTLYAMRWDYAYSNVNKQRGWHQYSTGVNWAGLVSGVMSNVYRSANPSAGKVYLTPKYK